MKKPLPKSPRRNLSELIFEKICGIIGEYDEKADIAVRGWTSKIEDIIEKKIKSLGICVTVKEADLTAVEDVAETEYRAIVKVTIDSFPDFQGADTWDADDLADVIAKRVGSGWKFKPNVAFEQYREIVVSDCKSRSSGTRKSAELTLKTYLDL